MNSDRKPSAEPLPGHKDNLIPTAVAWLVLIGGLGFILYATLLPFRFSFRPLSFSQYVEGYLLLPSSSLDFPRNIPLFMPFGFGLAALLDRQRWSNNSAVYTVLTAGFLLTLLVESLQHFLPGRTPTVSDLLANSLGAVVGLGCYRLWQNRNSIYQKVKAVLSVPRNVIVTTAAYVLLLLMLAFFLQNSTRLVGWDPDFKMLIGNEYTENRPWSGTVTQLAILDGAVSGSEAEHLLRSNNIEADAGLLLVAYYPLTSAADLSDRTDNLPDLVWQGALTSNDDQNLQLNENRWLGTALPVKYLSERLQDSSQFSIMLTIATSDVRQEGPGRILTISEDPHHRNLMLGQDGSALAIRVRTPLTGENGSVPEFVIDDFFVDDLPQQLIVTYDGLELQLYGLGQERLKSVAIVPGIAYARFLLVGNVLGLWVGSRMALILMLVFYIVFLIPVGGLLALLLHRIENPVRRRWTLLVGVCVPPIALELVFSIRTGFEPRLMNIVLGMLVVGVISFLLSFAVGQSLGSRRTS